MTANVPPGMPRSVTKPVAPAATNCEDAPEVNKWPSPKTVDSSATDEMEGACRRLSRDLRRQCRDIRQKSESRQILHVIPRPHGSPFTCRIMSQLR